MILFARYGVLLRPENLSGTDTTVDVFVTREGATEARTVRDGDVVMEVMLSETGTRAALWVAHDGAPWQLAPNQPYTGDLVVATCSANDVRYQAGSAAVFAEDGTFVGLNAGQTGG